MISTLEKRVALLSLLCNMCCPSQFAIFPVGYGKQCFVTVAGAGPGVFLREFDLIKLPYFLYVLGQIGLSKQCRLRSDAAYRGV